MVGAVNPRTGQYELADSELVSKCLWTKTYSEISNKVNRRITPHHMAGMLTPEILYNVMEQGRGSANYGIFSDGTIVQYVKESRRAWTSGSALNDNQAVTMEVENSTFGPDWMISAKAMESLIRLMADIALRNGIQSLNFTGDTSGNVTLHKWFAATACPGPYMERMMPEITRRANALMGGAMELGIGLNTITHEGVKFEVIKGYGNYKQAYMMSAPGAPATTALQDINKFDSNQMLVLGMINCNYFEMTRKDIYGSHYGAEYSVGDGIKSQALELPAYNPELLVFYQYKNGKCGWCRANNFHLAKHELWFALSPYSIRFHEGREINEISTCYTNKELVSTKQSAACMLRDGTWVLINSIDNCIVQTVVNLMKAIGAYEGFILDGGGSAQMIYIGQKIQYTGRQLPNVLALACYKSQEPVEEPVEEKPVEEEKPTENEVEKLRARVKELEEIIQKVRAIIDE